MKHYPGCETTLVIYTLNKHLLVSIVGIRGGRIRYSPYGARDYLSMRNQTYQTNYHKNEVSLF